MSECVCLRRSITGLSLAPHEKESGLHWRRVGEVGGHIGEEVPGGKTDENSVKQDSFGRRRRQEWSGGEKQPPPPAFLLDFKGDDLKSHALLSDQNLEDG